MLRDLASAVRSKRVSSRELVELALERIERHDRDLNAVVALRPEEALVEAARLDERIAAGEDPGPLAGIPFLVKDIEDLAGLRTTNGSALHADDRPAAADGLVPSRLRAAGAIPVGKTNTAEFAAQGFTDNLVFGATPTPWALEWSAGGSSGGSGAAVAAGMVPIATATDTGGSIRIPSVFCGLAGLKPTNGIVGRDHALWWRDLTTCGPLASHVDDLRLLLSVEAGPAPGDPTALPAWTPGSGRPTRLLATERFSPFGPLPPDVDVAFREALARAERAFGLPVERLDPKEIFRDGNADTDWFVITGPELVAWIGRERIEREMHRFYPTTQGFLGAARKISIDAYLDARERRFAHTLQLDKLLDDAAVIVSPTLAEVGWSPDGRLPGADEPGTPTEAYNCSVQNITGHPALTVPAGVLPNGVPFGVQLTGPRFRDDALLALGQEWERAEPWPAVAPGYEPFEA